MKKLALLLGTIVLVGTTAFAKETVVHEEILPPEIVFEEIVVDMQDTFKPTAVVNVEGRHYGKRGDNNSYERIQVETNVELTENQRFDIRGRDYTNNGKDVRVRYYLDHNEQLTSRLQYEDIENSSESIQYQLRYNFVNKDNGLLSKFVVAPTIGYGKVSAEDDKEKFNQYGLNTEMYGYLPLGFEWEFNTYNTHETVNGNSLVYDDGSKESNYSMVEFYLYNNVPLYTKDKLEISLAFEGGVDPYIHYYTGSNTDTLTLYAEPTIRADYSVNQYITMYTGAGLNYQNMNDHAKHIGDFEVQAIAYAGLNVKF
ncbi:MAG: FomA family porin-like outer membrane protein [Anaeroplasmataceae bacterium]